MRAAKEPASPRPASSQGKEFDFSDREFERLRRLIRNITGISLSDSKRDLVYGRFARRLRTLGLKTFEQYCDLIESGELDEVDQLGNAISTNLTSFFREPHHFDLLTTEVMPQIRSRSSRRLRIWSAGCSSGEEPYSIAITVLEALPDIAAWDARILATDLDSNMVRRALGGCYDAKGLESLDAARARRWFQPTVVPDTLEIADDARRLVVVKQLNLMAEWPMRGPFEVIFCRNTIIYFDKPTQRRLFERMAQLQRVGDYLFVGHSETLSRVTDRYSMIGRTVYRKVS